MWSITASSLLSFQPTRSFSNEEGRLCFYCLGLFKKQAFQIDHINPASQRAPNPAVYSNPTNLIPVCRTCNTAKGIKSLSTFWLDEQIAARQREGLPGVENAVGVTTPVPYPSYLDFVKAQRARVLGC
jgi:5-methylcytosine-specific restriction endonuclease McrA